MSEQQHARRQSEAEVEEEVEFRGQAQSENFDSLLDEIDSVLETNAEEFVKGFVQKGGQ